MVIQKLILDITEKNFKLLFYNDFKFQNVNRLLAAKGPRGEQAVQGQKARIFIFYQVFLNLK